MPMLKDILWKLNCPNSIEAIAEHFVTNHISIEQIENLDFSTVKDEYRDPWFAYKRRIGSIYGITKCYKSPDGLETSPGWNRRIFRKYKTISPDNLIESIFIETYNRLKKIRSKITI